MVCFQLWVPYFPKYFEESFMVFSLTQLSVGLHLALGISFRSKCSGCYNTYLLVCANRHIQEMLGATVKHSISGKVTLMHSDFNGHAVVNCSAAPWFRIQETHLDSLPFSEHGFNCQME